ncbi:MAG: chondroitin AC lyase [Pedobacter sp.]|nr:MAG: chondroitin AC lyase [Pedobacter sp.]
MKSTIFKIGMKLIITLTAIFILNALSFPCFADAEMDSVINRYKIFLVKTEKPDPQVSKWILDFDNGKWSNIDYRDKERGAWKTLEHLTRIRQMSIAWLNPRSPFFQNQTVLETIHAALNHWLQERYQNPNWWQNEIGVPQLMRDIIVLTRSQLSTKEFNGGLAIIHQFKVGGTGANLSWSADLGLHYAALTDNALLLDSCRNLLINEVKIGTKEGVQPDFSFHQHGERLQNFHYGKFFLTDNTRLAWQLRDTRWAFPEDKVLILAKLLTEGDRWMARGTFVVPAVVDRAISRPGFLSGGDLSTTLEMLKDLVPQIKKQLDTIQLSYKRVIGWKGYKNFPFSDFISYNEVDFGFYLKTISKRTLTSETKTNYENLKGRLLNSGNTYYIANGREYTDLMPVWNWDYLPGATNFDDTTTIERRRFNGSVDNGFSGLSAMDYALGAGVKQLTGHKIWAVHKGVMICLIAGLTTTDNSEFVYTALDQCRMQGVVQVNKPGNVVKEGIHNSSNVKWLFHSNFGYFPLYRAHIKLKTGPVNGSWQSVNKGQTAANITDKIFMPLISHGKFLRDGKSGYVVARCANASEAQRLNKRPFWRIVKNDITNQTVKFSDGVVMIAFFAKSKVQLSQSLNIEAKQPCLLIIEEKMISISDPNHTGGNFQISVGKEKYNVNVPSSGESIRLVRAGKDFTQQSWVKTGRKRSGLK